MSKLDLVKKIAAISGQMPAVAKKKDPTAGVSYAFRNVDAILDAVSPLLAAAELVQFTEVLECQIGKEEGFDRHGKPRTAWTAFVRMALVVTDGESEVRTVRSGFSMDYGDKAVTQAEQMALKYAVTFLYGVKTGDKDPDSESNAPLHSKPRPVSEEQLALEAEGERRAAMPQVAVNEAQAIKIREKHGPGKLTEAGGKKYAVWEQPDKKQVLTCYWFDLAGCAERSPDDFTMAKVQDVVNAVNSAMGITNPETTEQ